MHSLLRNEDASVSLVDCFLYRVGLRVPSIEKSLYRPRGDIGWRTILALSERVETFSDFRGENNGERTAGHKKTPCYI